MLLLHLAGATLLLLYSVRMVRTGIERAAGPKLRTCLIDHRGGGVANAAIGCVLAVVMQSATAAALLTVGFVAAKLFTPAGGLAVLLGADLGSALVVQILTFRLDWLIPLLLVVGGILFLKFERRSAKQAGRVLLGLALLLLSLRLIGEATAPLRESQALPVIIGFLEGQTVTAFLMGAVLAFALHSSVAAILLVIAFAQQGLIPVEMGMALILGCNLGGALLALWLTRGSGRAPRRAPMGNLILRAFVSMIFLACAGLLVQPLATLAESPGQQLVWLHLALNAAVLLVGLPLVAPLQRLLCTLLPDEDRPAGDEREPLRPTRALDERALASPKLALANVTREVLHMAELVEIMARPAMELYETGEQEQIRRLVDLDTEVNSSFAAIKGYVAALNRQELSEEERQHSLDLMDFAINLESAGDIVSKRLLTLAKKKNAYDLSFSREGWYELTGLHDRVMVNIQLAINVLITNAPEAARELVEEKDRMRVLEQSSRNEHLNRLRRGLLTSQASSNLHLETLRALKEVNALFASIGQRILQRHGQLRASRLVEPKGAAQAR
ncbi:MAG: Na/Pi cotransporter family protein [Kiloniellales bacterium]